MDHNYILGFIFSMISSVGFSVLFSCPKKSIFWGGITGAIGWTIYSFIKNMSQGMYIATLLGAYVTGIIGEVFARKFHMPASLFIIPGIINLVPGAGIYYTLFYFVNDQMNMGMIKLFQTLAIAGAISFGVLLASASSSSLRKFKFRKPTKKYDWKIK